jgi:phosphoribosyl-ATP pyrophosphohydrolase
MKLPILNLDKYESYKQFEKIKEECSELVYAHLNDDDCGELEETFDLIQVTFGYLLKIATLEEIQEYAERHYQKLIDRKWETDGHIEIKFHYK